MFLPQLLLTEDVATSETYLEYHNVLSALTALFEKRNDSLNESREDVYMIGNSHFGAKLRAGKKVEVKIRVRKLDFNIEHWKKVKLGKKSISHYRNDILELIESDADQRLSDDATLIDAGSVIHVRKARSIQILHDISKEICFISSPDSSRQWISIAVEGALNDIRNFLLAADVESDLGLIFNALGIASKIAKRHIATSTELTTFLPVVAGYPTWIRVASQVIHAKEMGEILDGVDSFLQKVRHIEDPTDTSHLLGNTDSKIAVDVRGRRSCCAEFCT